MGAMEVAMVGKEATSAQGPCEVGSSGSYGKGGPSRKQWGMPNSLGPWAEMAFFPIPLLQASSSMDLLDVFPMGGPDGILR